MQYTTIIIYSQLYQLRQRIVAECRYAAQITYNEQASTLMQVFSYISLHGIV